jgi:hypothetical protein
MDKMKRQDDLFTKHLLQATEFATTGYDSKVHIADKRIARLLLVLHELDQYVAGLEQLPQDELIDLVSNAIRACGFSEGTEARYAIAAVLEAIDRCDPTPESS